VDQRCRIWLVFQQYTYLDVITISLSWQHMIFRFTSHLTLSFFTFNNGDPLFPGTCMVEWVGFRYSLQFPAQCRYGPPLCRAWPPLCRAWPPLCRAWPSLCGAWPPLDWRLWESTGRRGIGGVRSRPCWYLTIPTGWGEVCWYKSQRKWPRSLWALQTYCKLSVNRRLLCSFHLHKYS